MRTFKDLNHYEKIKAYENTFHALVAQIAEGVIIVDGKLGQKVNNAIKDVSQSTDPYAAYKAVVKSIGDELRPLAAGAAEDATYDLDGNVIYEIN